MGKLQAGDAFGEYLHRWDANAVARSFRRKGYSVGVRKIHTTLFKVKILKTPEAS